ncbi:Holliday junction branch migration protein RuvA [Prochlorococcus sp. MIT 1341]|uniref:Holliday junction branch migration protein RuvA n=1 Tax=Prochlorococcus sp. MIT 1341 TaxID=3096221 RepID=UPI002A764D9F|nr:Holliday junction branch migration protein RuvA [Prochlorococcus sp. MIT 1341]
MIAWLQGQKLESWRLGNRQGVLIACGGVGYEVHTSLRHQIEIEPHQNVVLWIHHIQREETEYLYGFPKRIERDLFRILISVNGVGPQLALVLLDKFEGEDLIEALVEADIQKLCQVQGVGKRTAERLAIELETKLSHLESTKEELLRNKINPVIAKAQGFEELHSSLSSLGYEDLEIRRAFQAIASDSKHEAKEGKVSSSDLDDPDQLLRASLLWLTREAA